MATHDTRTAERGDIEYYQNDELNYSFYVTDRSTGDPIDVSGDVLNAQIKRKKTDTEDAAVANLSTTAGTIVVSGINGNIVTLTGQYDLDLSSYYYDVENTTQENTIRYGRFKVTGDTTRV